MDAWRLERQNQTITHQSGSVSTRVLQHQTQNLSLSSRFMQDSSFPRLREMRENEEEDFGDMSSSSQMAQMRKRMEQSMSMAGGGGGIGDMSSMGFSNFRTGTFSTEGMSMTAVKREQSAVFSSSTTSNMMSSDGFSTGSSITGSGSGPWMELNSGSRLGGFPSLLSSNAGGKTTIMSTGSSSSSMATATASGVTRSFSSGSGFPSSSLLMKNENPPMNMMRLNQSKNAGPDDVIDIDASPTPPLPMSPFRRAPFNFRNFDGPVWADNNIMPMGMNMNMDLRDNRLTWDSSRMKGQMSFTASQQKQTAFFESTNGVVRGGAYREDKTMVLRQSYGASESESDDDDDDDDSGEFKKISFAQRHPIAYTTQKLALTDTPYIPPPSEDDTSSCPPSEIEEIPDTDITPRASIAEPPKTPDHNRCYKVAQELLTTERTYVKILHLIDQVFQFRIEQENKKNSMFPSETIKGMFCNIKSLYQFHHDHLLPRLELRLERWEDDPRIGDIMKESAPFLKMYSEYVQNFDNSINLINIYRDKNSRFADIVNEVQKMEECANLPIQHHLIGPIQRIPRYRLLLEAYLKRLPEDSNDRVDTEQALETVSKAAEHANEAMRRIAGFKKLLEVQEQIKGAVDLVSPTRMLVKEGKISKISARSANHQDRYLFLFSDMVLLCSMRTIAALISPYQLRAKIDVAEMTISEGDDLEIVNTFYIQDDNKRIELYTQTAEEKRLWMEAMYQARMDLLNRKSSLRLGSTSPSEDELGLKEPARIRSDSVLKCMECDIAFTMLKRRHHCHSCGIVVCSKCSSAKLPMQYASGKLGRVCGSCKTILQNKEAARRNGSVSNPSSPDESDKVHGILDVSACEPAVLSGYLNLRLRGKKEWTTRWFALRSDFVLYCYAKDSDERAMTATPIPGMTVLMAEELPKNDTISLPPMEKERAFRIAHGHGRKCFFFLAASKEEAVDWVEKLLLARNADLSNVKNP